MDAVEHGFKPDVVLRIASTAIEARTPGLRECLN